MAMLSKTESHGYSNSPHFKRLTNIIEHIGIELSVDDLIELLMFIDAPQSLKHFFFPARELPAIATVVQSACKGPLWTWTHQHISQPAHISKIISQSEKQMCTYMMDDSIAWLTKKLRSTRNVSLIKSTGQHDLYKVLGCRPRDSRHRNRYHQLQAHTLISALVFQQHADVLMDTHIKLFRDGMSAVRQLAQPDYQSTLKYLTDESIKTPEQYRRYLSGLKPKTDKIDKVVELLDQAIDFNRQSHNKVGRKKILEIPRQENRVTVLYPVVHHDDEKEDHLHKLIQNLPNTPDQAQNAYTILSPPGLITNFAPSSYERNLIQAGKQIAKANQLLSIAWPELTQYDISSLIHEISGRHSTDAKKLKTNAYLNLMFWAGLNAAAITKLSSGINAMAPPCYLTSGRLRLISEGPKLKKQYDSTYRVEKQSHMDLQLPDCASQAIEQALSKFPGLFQAHPQKILQLCKSRLRRIKVKHSARRLTLSRIWNYHFRYLSRMPGCDISTAALTLGRSDFLAKTKIHYSSFDSEMLKETFRESCCQILQSCGVDICYRPAINYQKTKNVGTPLRLKKKTVTDTVHRLQTLIRSRFDTLSKEKSNTSDLIRFHNDYSTYTALFSCFGTGHRRTKTPYIYQAHWDPQTQIACIRDKDTADYQHSRIVWLPDQLIEQMNNYREHLRNLYLMLGYEIPHDKHVPADFPEFFFIVGNKARIDYKTFAHKLAHIGYNFDGHPQRHLLKSELQENGCDPEVLEAFLGHWHTGQEPWARTSSLHPAYFMDELRRYLPPLLTQLDFKPLKGVQAQPDIPLKVFFPENTKQHYQNQDDVKSGSTPLMLAAPPGQVWFDTLPLARQRRHFDVAFRSEEVHALSAIKKHLPKIYCGEGIKQIVTEQQMTDLIKDICPMKLHPKKRHRRLNFLCNGLKRGIEKYQWESPLPHVPKAIPTERNRIRPYVFERLTRFRAIEAAFLQDLEKPIPSNQKEQMGQIILSAILYGGLLEPKWIEALRPALAQGFYQYHGLMWLDLNVGNCTEETPEQRFKRQLDPEAYRRWFPDPLTQILIYRWLRENREQRKIIRSSSWSAVTSYLNKRIKVTPPKGLRELLYAARPYYTLTLPSFLCSYAENNLPSASLPDPLWLRSLTGLRFRVPYKRRKLRISKNVLSRTNISTREQREYYKTLQSFFEKKFVDAAKKQAQKENRTVEHIIKKEIRRFLKQYKNQLCPMLHLLTHWAYQLLSDRRYTEERHKKGPLKLTSIQGYLGQFGENLIILCRELNPLEFTHSSFIDLYKTYNETHSPNSETLNRLKQFHTFLVIYYDAPELEKLEVQLGEKKNLRPKSISTNFITVQQHRDILKKLGFGKKNLSRNETMTLVAEIIAFWSGIRKEELRGLTLADIQLTPDGLEIHIFPNDFRTLKSSSAIRRIPHILIADNTELQFIRGWITRRQQESTTKRIDRIPLFSKSQATNEIISEHDLYGKARQTIKLYLMDESAVYHHLRDSFLQNLYLRLLLRDDIPIHHKPFFLQAECFSLESRREFKEQLFPNDRSGRKFLFGAATLIGHADTLEGFRSYFHLTDWLLGYYVRHPKHLPKLSNKVLDSLTRNDAISKPRHASDLISVMQRQYKMFESDPRNLLPGLLEEGIPATQKRGPKPTERGLPDFDIAYDLAIKNNLEINLQSAEEIRAAKEIYERIQALTPGKQRRYQELFSNLNNSYINHRRDLRYLQLTDKRETSRCIKLLKEIQIRIIDQKATYHPSRYTGDANKSTRDHRLWENELNTRLKRGGYCQIEKKYDCIRVKTTALDLGTTEGDVDSLDVFSFFILLFSISLI